MSLTLLIGHRGVGKSTLLTQIQKLWAETGEGILCFDLDLEIEKASGCSIQEIFQKYGEDRFRTWEQEQLLRLANDIEASGRSGWIALGAGYQGAIPKGARCLWVRRSSDRDGRVFLDRPRLLTELKPYAESCALLKRREAVYRSLADEELFLREGEQALAEATRLSLGPLGISEPNSPLGGILTLEPKIFQGPHWKDWWRRRKSWGMTLEWRTDWLPQDQMSLFLEQVPASQRLLSLRQEALPPSSLLSSFKEIDWPLELGEEIPPAATILSIHERNSDPIERVLSQLESRPEAGNLHLKVALPVNDFKELELLWNWWRQDPTHRSILPRSTDGRWNWFRQLMKSRQKMNFWREGQGSAPDQPVLAEWMSVPEKFQGFAAVIGEPVWQSFSPCFHQEFFEQRHMPFLAVQMSENEWRSGAFEFLQNLGLRAAAITSPLKTLSEPQTQISINTQVRSSDEQWRKANTDLIGLKRWRQLLDLDWGRTAIWGGGGMLNSLLEVWPEAIAFSARTGKARGAGEARSMAAAGPEVLIWSVGRGRMPDCQWPPAEWRPKTIVDLNYTENSPGREYALLSGARYISGQGLFELQAQEQQKFWKDFLPMPS